METEMQHELIAFHLAHNTPLRQLANCVRWFEENAKRSTAKDAKAWAAKAVTMRAVITALFIERDRAGQYAEA